ncbi:MAG: hypothetical protein QM539_05580 [Alphaproteobacteria bacterium]|nr:hypothetical protein [Alphaproteobacteria bacterium]
MKFLYKIFLILFLYIILFISNSSGQGNKFNKNQTEINIENNNNYIFFDSLFNNCIKRRFLDPKQKFILNYLKNRDDSILFFYFNFYEQLNTKEIQYHKLDTLLKFNAEKHISSSIDKVLSNIYKKTDTSLSLYLKFLSTDSQKDTTIYKFLSYYELILTCLTIDDRFLMNFDVNTMGLLYCLIGNKLEANMYLNEDFYKDYDVIGDKSKIQTNILGYNVNFTNRKNEPICNYTPPNLQKYYLNGFNYVFNEYLKYKLFEYNNPKVMFYLDSCIKLFNKIYSQNKGNVTIKFHKELQLALNNFNEIIQNFCIRSSDYKSLYLKQVNISKLECIDYYYLIYLRALAQCLLGNTEAANVDFKIIQDYAPNLPIFKIKSCN